MARKFRGKDDFDRHLKNKYGLGHGKFYKPWFTVKDVKDNKAFRKEIQGLTIPRAHHLLSSLEYALFLTMDFREDVIDIREQFPLIPLSLSRKIAIRFGIPHPVVVAEKGAPPFLMTTDLLVTIKDRHTEKYVAFSVKTPKELRDKRVLEKLEIERLWWSFLGVQFKIFTGNQRVKYQSHNILWATDIERHGLHEAIAPFAEHAAQLISVGKVFKQGLCDTFAEQFNLDSIDALNLLRYIIGKKFIQVELAEDYLDKAKFIDVIANQFYEPEAVYAC